MRPLAAFLDKAVSDEEVSHRDIEYPVNREIALKRDPKRKRRPKAKGAINEHMPIQIAWNALGRFPYARWSTRVGQGHLKLVPVNRLFAFRDCIGSPDATLPVLRESMERREARPKHRLDSFKSRGVLLKPRRVHRF